MASMFIAVLFIKNVSNTNKYIAGTTVYRAGNDKFLIINQYIPLNISTTSDDSTVYDLPVTPAFGIFTGLFQDSAITKIDRHQRLEDLECITEKFNSHFSSIQHLYKKPPQPFCEPNLNLAPSNLTSEQIRINQLCSSLNNVRGQGDPSNSSIPETLNTNRVINK
ncbi:1756_t:CDS:2, partial [Gigaspora margarita]